MVRGSFAGRVSDCLLCCHGIGSDASARGGEASQPSLIDRRCGLRSFAPPRSADRPRVTLRLRALQAGPRTRTAAGRRRRSVFEAAGAAGERRAAGGSGRRAAVYAGPWVFRWCIGSAGGMDLPRVGWARSRDGRGGPPTVRVWPQVLCRGAE